MKLSVELTLYPFNENYLEPIKGFIAKLNTVPHLTTQTFPSATIIVGEHDQVMDALKMLFRWSVDNYGKVVFVAKFLPNTELLQS